MKCSVAVAHRRTQDTTHPADRYTGEALEHGFGDGFEASRVRRGRRIDLASGADER